MSTVAGTWDLGGGGGDRIFQAPSGATVTKVGNSLLNVTLPVYLTSGNNSISYSYESPTFFEGSVRAGHQSLGDEGWQLGQVTVTAVPEPETYAMMLAGLGLLGFLARRKNAQKLG